MRIVFLSRYQKTAERGAENFAKELTGRLSRHHAAGILTGADADSLGKVLQGKYDVVIPLNGRMQSLKMSLGRLTGKYKLVISGHSGIGRDDIWNIAVVRPDVFVALTERMLEWAKHWAWGSRVVKIPNGIDLDKFKPDGTKINLKLPGPVVLCVGALVWYKHHERVIKAVAGLKEGSLLIVGDGPLEKRLREMGKKLLGKRFRLIKANYRDMPKIYRSADLFTLPSWNREAFGLVYLEALASGLGVVAPDDSSRREIIGEAGVLINTKDAGQYKNALDKGLKINWQKKARIQADKFSWNKIAKEYEKMLEELISE